MSEEVRNLKRRRSDSEGPEEEVGDGVGADVVGAVAPGPEVLDNGGVAPATENPTGEEADDAAAQAAADAAAAAVEQPKMTTIPTDNYNVQVSHHQPRVEEKPAVDTYYKTEPQTVDTGDYKVANVGGMSAAGMASAGMGTGGMTSGTINAGGMSTAGISTGGMGAGLSASGMNTGISAATVGNMATGGMGAGGMASGGMTAGGMNAAGMTAGGMGAGGMSAANMVPGLMGAGGMSAAALGVSGMGTSALGAGGMANLSALGPMANLAANMGISAADLNQQLLSQQYRGFDYTAMIKAQAQAAAQARAQQPKPVSAPPGRKSAPSSYEPPVQLTASGRPARARRVNYAELAGAMDDEEEDDQTNLVPNWARRRRKNSDQDRDYGPGLGSGSRGGGSNAGGAGGSANMYGMAGAGGYNSAPRAAAPTAGVNLYGLTGQGAAGLRAAGAAGAGMQAANLAGMANANAALANQVGWQGQVWGQNANLGGYNAAALQSLAQQQARPQQVAQQFLMQQGAGRAVNPMDAMQLMLGRGADGQGGMPGAGQQR